MACEESIKNFLAGRKRAYLWTFTLPDMVEPRQGAERWCNLSRRLKLKLKFAGIRVYELHPGGHGLHVHVICRSWYNVNVVRVLAEGCGFGRINVTYIDASRGVYIAKYLNKALGDGNVGRLRWWGVMGWADYTRQYDIVIRSAVHAVFDRLRQYYDTGCRGWALPCWNRAYDIAYNLRV